MSKILIIDDSKLDRLILEKIVTKNLQGIEVLHSENGLDVFDLLKREPIKSIILDLKMPEVSGVDLLSEIKANPRYRDIPVIVCSGVIDNELIHEVFEAGAFEYFKKPLTAVDMQLTLPLKVRNAMELYNRTEEILHLSNTDALTGLFNRKHFQEILKSDHFEEVFPSAIIMGDINGLKVVNDAYGSDAGDDYLKVLAEIIREVCGDTMACRWGGDEFAIAFERADKDSILEYMAQIKNRFEVDDRNHLKLTVALGCDLQVYETQEMMKVLTNAEDIMFRDKVLDSGSVRSKTVSTILNTLLVKNKREEAHSRRVGRLCEAMGNAMGLSMNGVRDIKVIGLVHDIGKTAIDESILNKEARLTDEEWLEMRRHPEIGYRILGASNELREYAEAIYCHHEKYDGSGYPRGIVGEDIPLYSRILTIVDSYDAMTGERTYKKVLSKDEAIAELKKCSGTQFDPNLVPIFIDVINNEKDEQ